MKHFFQNTETYKTGKFTFFTDKYSCLYFCQIGSSISVSFCSRLSVRTRLILPALYERLLRTAAAHESVMLYGTQLPKSCCVQRSAFDHKAQNSSILLVRFSHNPPAAALSWYSECVWWQFHGTLRWFKQYYNITMVHIQKVALYCTVLFPVYISCTYYSNYSLNWVV